MKFTQELVEKQHRPDDRADHPGRHRRRPGRDRAAVSSRSRRRSRSTGVKPYAAAAARRARHLHPRRLLQLPLADDPSVPRRDRALRPLLGGRRVRLRPSVPVGQQAHRPRPRARRRPLLATSGTACTSNNPRDVVPESNMPAYPWLAKTPLEPGDDRPPKMRALRRVGVPYTDEEIAKAPAERRRQDRAGRADRLPAGARPRTAQREVAMEAIRPSPVSSPCSRSSSSSASSSGRTARGASPRSSRPPTSPSP